MDRQSPAPPSETSLTSRYVEVAPLYWARLVPRIVSPGYMAIEIQIH